MSLSTSKMLDEAIKAGYVVRKHPDYSMSNQYWQWCEANAKPFVAITVGGPRARYATVEYDLFLTSFKGFSPIALKEIKGFVLGQKLKRGSMISIGPIITIATMDINAAVPTAKYFYQSAIDEGVCLPPEELIRLTIESHRGEP